MIVLGIETSCDETGVALVRDDRSVLSHLVLSQIKDHAVFGGVVPEIAARAHLDHLDRLIAAALKEADIGFSDLDGVAATCGPGLIGGVMVGMMAGKAISLAHNKPFLAVNHLEAHLLSPRLVADIPYPFLVLLVSGGHTQILIAEGLRRYRLWGTTRDDAIGECFDKSAKLMGLPYPGGPHLEKLAAECLDPQAAREQFPFSVPMQHMATTDFSFSGLKTAVRTVMDRLGTQGPIARNDLANLACSLQQTLSETLCLRVRQAMQDFRAEFKTENPSFAVCGGVAANKNIRAGLENLCSKNGFAFMAPPMEYCTDNGAMIAWAGVELLKAEEISPLSVPARPRWPLAELAASVTAK
jgi:N6-L-threonylcarbamoyladenine synthase